MINPRIWDEWGETMLSKKEDLHLFENGHLNDEMTARYADAVFDGSTDRLGLPEEALQHVESCVDCKDRILELSMFLRNPDAGEINRSDRREIVTGAPWAIQTRRRRYLYPMRIAALFFVAALLIGTYFFVYKDGSAVKDLLFKSTGTEETQPPQGDRKGDPPQETKIPRETGETSETTAHRVIPKRNVHVPSNFRVNPNLESMIGTRYRSVSVQVLSPRDNTTLTVGSDIDFTWKLTNPGPVTFKIIDNRNRETCQYEVRGGRFTLKERLGPGLYYWKLEDHQDLLYIGKFFIKKKQ